MNPPPMTLTSPPANRASRPFEGVSRSTAETIEDQIAWFLDHHSMGFETPLWLTDHRGEGADSRLKRHRDAAVAEAQKLLSPERLRTHMAAGDFTGVVTNMIKVLTGTTLVPVGRARSLTKLDPSAHPEVARALLANLDPKADGDGGFGRLVSALAPALPKTKRCGWSLITAVRALVFPNAHVCVVPGKFALQAKILGRPVPAAGTPCEQDYLRYREVALEVDRRLRDRGVPPKDLIDVLDFMRFTLSPRARVSLAGAAGRRRQRLGSEEYSKRVVA